MVSAQEPDADSTVLKPIVVTATRTETDVYETLSGSSALTREQLETLYPGGSVPQIVTAIPGMTTQTSGDDPGVAVNIRGLQDFGRVNVLVDGARQNFQKNGHEANGTFYMDTQMLKSVDVTRGPVSSVYGSGAIGGVVNFTTIDADDLIEGGADKGGRIRAGLDTNGLGPTLNGAAAARFEDSVDVLVGGTLQRLEDYRSGENEAVQSAQSLRSGLAKLRVRPVEDQEFTVSGSRYNSVFDNGAILRDTHVTVDTLTGGYRYTPDSDLWDLSVKGYSTSTLSEQYDPTGAVSGLEQSFNTRTTGLDLFNTSRFDTGAIAHEMTYGGDFFRDRVETIDDTGSSDDLTPSGTRIAYGAFIQDQIGYDDWLKVTGALRYDAYKLHNDTIEVDGNRLSPKLTVGVTPWEPVTVYATYAEGYRAPALTETLIDGFHPPPATGRFFPNPNLRPEVARTVEAGMNLRFADVLADGDTLAMKVGVYENNVDDYIDMVFQMFPIPGGYQYRNIAKARIRGIEMDASWDAGAAFASLSGQLMKGENLTDGTTLQKVPPWRAVATVGGRFLDGETLTLGTRLTVVGAREDDMATGFVGRSYQLVDVFAEYEIADNMSANVSLNNIFNRDYTQYLNADPSPGFNAKAFLTVKF